MEYWQYHDKKMKELKSIYIKIDNQTRNRLQEIFNRFEITLENLHLYVDNNIKNQVNTYIEEWKEKGYLKGYFGILAKSIYSKKNVKYLEILELLIYEVYIEQQEKEKKEEDLLFFSLFSFYFLEGQKEVNDTLINTKKKKYSTFTQDLFSTLMMTPNTLGYVYEDYKNSITKYNAEQLSRQAVINIMQGKELKIDSSEFSSLINKQQNAKLNINGDKISGAVDNTLIAMNNQAKVQGITAIDNDAQVKFISINDEKRTKMCESLDGQIFSVKNWNEFTRYSASNEGLVKYRCKGLVVGLNLPPINDHFHFCRSTIIYINPQSKIDNKNDTLEIKGYSRKTSKYKNKINNILSKIVIINNVLKMNKIFKDFPNLKAMLETVKLKENIDADMQVFMKKNGKIELQINKNSFNNLKKLKEAYKIDNVKKSTYKNIGMHEAGHIVEASIIRKIHNGNVDKMLKDWNNGITSRNIVENAFENLGITNKMEQEKCKYAISSYALVNDTETIAEALLDYYINKKKANKLSKEIFKIMRGM